MRTICERESNAGETTRNDLYNLETVYEKTRDEGKALNGRLRDEDLL